MMKKVIIFTFALFMSVMMSAQEKFEVTLNAIDTWMGSELNYEANMGKLKEGEFDNTFFEFAENGILTVTRYQGEMTNLKKTEKQYQYKFDEDLLRVTADGKTQNIIYSLGYHSYRHSRSLILFYWDSQDKQLELLSGEDVVKMKKNFEEMQR